MSPLLIRLRKYFCIDARGSSIPVELLAGVSTFLALSYIFVVNPSILAQAGMDNSSVLFATILTSGLATIVMGVWARLPFALAPGMEMNAYFAFYVVQTLGLAWEQALGAVFWSGVLFVALTLTRVREQILSAIPYPMQSALSLSVGVFLTLVAMKLTGIVRYQGVKIIGIGSLISFPAFALYLGLIIILTLDRLNVKGSVMIGILLVTGLCYVAGMRADTERPAELSSKMLSGIGRLSPLVILKPRSISAIVVLFLIDFYGSMAKLIGLTVRTNLMVRGKLPRLREALLTDSVGAVLGSALGTSSIMCGGGTIKGIVR